MRFYLKVFKFICIIVLYAVVQTLMLISFMAMIGALLYFRDSLEPLCLASCWLATVMFVASMFFEAKANAADRSAMGHAWRTNPRVKYQDLSSICGFFVLVFVPVVGWVLGYGYFLYEVSMAMSEAMWRIRQPSRSQA